jgi:hypothetical protein
MNDDAKQRRYNEEEFALILRKASELQASDRGGSAPGTSEGLTLDEIRSIAVEAGMDTEAITRAASLLGLLEWEERGSLAAAIFGGPSKYHLEFEVPGTLPSEELGRILAEIRRSWEHQGEASEVLGGLQWKTARGELSQVTVNIAPRGEATHIQIVGDRNGASAVTFVFPMMGAAILVGALGGTFEPTSVAGIVSLITGTLGAGFLTARTLWASGSRKFKGKLTRLVDALTTSVGRGARPGGSPESDP